MPSNSGSIRSLWLDAARGFGIILVVWGHVVRGLFTSHLASPDLLGIVDEIIYLFHMPLFFLLAGINIDHSLSRGRIEFIKGKLQSVVFPYLLWSLVQGGLMMALSGTTNRQVVGSDLASILWAPIGQFWFLYALFVAQLILATLPRNRAAWLTMAIIGIAATSWLPMTNIMQRSAFALFYVAIGMAGGVGLIQGRRCALISLAIFAISAVTATCFHLREVWPGFAIPAALAGSTLVICLSKAISGRALTALAYLGERSMTIFVLHVMAAAAARIMLLKLGVTLVPIHIVSGIAVGIIAPLITHAVLVQTGLLPWAGLGRFRQQPKSPLPQAATP